MTDTPLTRQAIEIDSAQLPGFYPLLQSGVRVPVDVGCSLKSMLCDQLAIPADYVTERITTIFLDNHPVDDLEHAIIRDGSKIALSAAMPGLVGATMRRGGYYATLRQGISQLAQDDPVSRDNGVVTIKLFNLLLGELGPTILARGLLVEQNELAELLQALPSAINRSTAGRTLLSVTLRE